MTVKNQTRRLGETDSGAMARLALDIDQGWPDECWPWTGRVNHAGYGTVHWYRDGSHSTLVHRLAYELYVGPIPAGHHVHHRCFMRSCCNPVHLAIVGASDHMHIHHPGPEATCGMGHAKTPENTGKHGRCLACQTERDRQRTGTPERKRQAAAAARKRKQDAEYATQRRAYQREWAARRRKEDPEFAERERQAAREYQRRRRRRRSAPASVVQ